MIDSEIVAIANDFKEFNAFIEGEDTINGQTLDLLSRAPSLSSIVYTDSDCIEIMESIIKQYHLWHKMSSEKLGE
jgi:hypothetical protein